ncbi:solute carrier family 45 member 3 [Eurytemora carolleeae]|uniref:solute carrier family 45 member 3 n=1 Tax=Eurytemora carolleeae TaxID=1294199 RepID=UPI000C75D749|nr:solute carrier family 45 member 3 [Eurytemora carolleeae]XP_023323955.1 solute carrier family 45 member 3 [Eurytemora carolleeae]XP_023323956.1 solute carrier family 45 member 3 [Eurytemora carolleeae]|eukprot:XP_023323954.1 solute carrier family 45 member 3-like [Eurytemora affinis]
MASVMLAMAPSSDIMAASVKMSSSPLSIWRLVAVNAVVAGLEIAACVAFTFIPPLLLKSGFSETEMTIVLGIAPFIALFTVPELGKWSDRCTSRLGRRRPFILLMSAILVFSLILLFVGQTLSLESKSMKLVLLAVGVVLLDYSSQAAINPCEALVSDIVAETTGSSMVHDQPGFTVYSGMLSVGACFGYLLTALDWDNLGISVGNREQTAFLLVLFLYLVCCCITMIYAVETPFLQGALDITKSGLTETESDPGYESDEILFSGKKMENMELLNRGKERPVLRAVDVSLPLPNLPDLSTPLSSLHLRDCRISRIPATLLKIIKHFVYLPLTYYQTIRAAPPVLFNLFIADLFSWIAIMAHGMFYTDFVATAVYGGQPDAPSGSVYDILFDEGVRMGSWGLLLHSVTAGIYAVFIQEHVTNAFGLRISYQIGLIVFSVSMGATVMLSSSLSWLNLAAAGSGLGYAVVTTIPNTLVTMYQENHSLYYGPNVRGGVGEAIAILDSGYYLSQICLSLVMGRLVEMTGLPHYYIYIHYSTRYAYPL